MQVCIYRLVLVNVTSLIEALLALKSLSFSDFVHGEASFTVSIHKHVTNGYYRGFSRLTHIYDCKSRPVLRNVPKKDRYIAHQIFSNIFLLTPVCVHAFFDCHFWLRLPLLVYLYGLCLIFILFID